jgi:predicted amidohydrolase YtcJ
MRAAISRRTLSGQIVGAAEALDPETALALYLADPADLARQRRVEPGAPADLCLLSLPWTAVRGRLDSGDVRAVLVGGRIVHDGVDKAP